MQDDVQDLFQQIGSATDTLIFYTDGAGRLNIGNRSYYFHSKTGLLQILNSLLN